MHGPFDTTTIKTIGLWLTKFQKIALLAELVSTNVRRELFQRETSTRLTLMLVSTAAHVLMCALWVLFSLVSNP